jgi:hypothetical protein
MESPSGMIFTGASPGSGGFSVPPVQAVPLSAKPDGVAAAPVALKPKEAVPPVAIAPFQEALRTVTAGPDWVTLPFHSCVTLCPEPNVKVSVHELTAAPRLVIVAEAPKPPGHWLDTA